jgi:hypothetical protein
MDEFKWRWRRRRGCCARERSALYRWSRLFSIKVGGVGLNDMDLTVVFGVGDRRALTVHDHVMSQAAGPHEAIDIEIVQ